MSEHTTATIARVNGIALHAPDEALDAGTLRQRACTEMLRQEARLVGIEVDGDEAAIEALLDREIGVPEPDETACRRWFEAHAAQFERGERVRLRHVLFAVTPRVDVDALRTRAEALLHALRCADPDDPAGDAFAAAAKASSNCPTGAFGGELGWLTKEDCAPEFAREVFGTPTLGVMPRLVHSRHGFHVVDVREREPGTPAAYEDVRDGIALRLRHQAWANALRRYLHVLAARHELEGVAIDEG